MTDLPATRETPRVQQRAATLALVRAAVRRDGRGTGCTLQAGQCRQREARARYILRPLLQARRFHSRWEPTRPGLTSGRVGESSPPRLCRRMNVSCSMSGDNEFLDDYLRELTVDRENEVLREA